MKLIIMGWITGGNLGRCNVTRSAFHVSRSVFRVPCSVFHVPCFTFHVPCTVLTGYWKSVKELISLGHAISISRNIIIPYRVISLFHKQYYFAIWKSRDPTRKALLQTPKHTHKPQNIRSIFGRFLWKPPPYQINAFVSVGWRTTKGFFVQQMVSCWQDIESR